MVKRIAGRSQNEQVEKWLESQNNLNQSLNNIISHMIRIFGYRDITEYEVQEFLFTQILDKEFKSDNHSQSNYNNPSDLSWLYLGKSESGKTNLLKDILHIEKDGFNVVITQYDEYRKELTKLKSEGISIAEESKVINSSNIDFAKQMELAQNVSIDRKKILYIITDVEINGFSKEPYEKFINYLFQEQYNLSNKDRDSLFPMRIIIDGNNNLINCIPKEIVRVCRARKMAFVAAAESLKELSPDITNNFHKKHL